MGKQESGLGPWRQGPNWALSPYAGPKPVLGLGHIQGLVGQSRTGPLGPFNILTLFFNMNKNEYFFKLLLNGNFIIFYFFNSILTLGPISRPITPES